VPEFQVSRRARRELLQIADDLSDFSARAALEFIDTMELAFQQLQTFPECGVARPDLGRHVRTLTRAPWLVVYSYQENRVEVVRIVSARRGAPTDGDDD
jgi:plasmid stabilization system protein ParE